MSGVGSSLLNHRTLYEIVWGCLVTTFACTWVALHPGVPLSSVGHRKSTPTRWAILRRRGISTLGIVIAPEFVIVRAIGERMLAGRIVNEYNRFCDQGEFCELALECN